MPVHTRVAVPLYFTKIAHNSVTSTSEEAGGGGATFNIVTNEE